MGKHTNSCGDIATFQNAKNIIELRVMKEYLGS
jgi:hypothetical protein